MTETEIRALFPGVESGPYLNSAAAALLPAPVRDAVAAVVARQAAEGVRGFADELETVREARAASARLIGARTDDVALVAGTADGISRIAVGLDWCEGDEVVVGDLEYPAMVYPWAAQCDRGVRLRVVRSNDGRIPAERIIEAIGPRTRVVAVSMVQFTSGYRVDLAKLANACRDRRVPLVVDAIQGLGVFPVDVTGLGVSALAADGRKWLMGPAGCSIFWISPELRDRVRTRVVGAASVRDMGDFLQFNRHVDAQGRLDVESLLRPNALRFEPGFPNVIGSAGLGAALALGESIGRDVIRERVRANARRAEEHARRRGFALFGDAPEGERSGIVSFAVPGDVGALERGLARRRICVAVRDGRVRIAPHVFNTLGEVDRTFEAIDAERERR